MTPREELEELRRLQANPGVGTQAEAPAQESPRQELERLRAAEKVAGAQQATTSGGIADEVGGFLKNAAKGGVANLARMGGNLQMAPALFSPAATPVLLERRRRAMEAAKELDKDTGFGGFVGGVATDIAGTAGIPGASAVPRMATAAQQAGSRFTSALPRAMGTGAVGGAYSSENPAVGAATGAVAGGAMQQATSRGANRAADPFHIGYNQDAQAAFQRGDPLTVGQASNPNTIPGRMIRQAEESFAALPVFGAGIRAQREAAERAVRDRTLNEVSAGAGTQPRVPTRPQPQVPGGHVNAPIPDRPQGVSFRDVMDEVGGDVSARYTGLLSGRTARPTGVFRRELRDIVDNPQHALTAQQRSALNSTIQSNLIDPTSNVMGQTVRNWDLPVLWAHQSSLRTQGRKLVNNPASSVQDRHYGQTLVDAADATKDFITRRHPRIGPELRSLDQPFAQLQTVRDAARRAGPSGEFTPRHLYQSASKRGPGAQGMVDEAAFTEPLVTPVRQNTRNVLTGAALHGVTGGLTAPLHLAMSFGPTQRAMTGRLGFQQRLAHRLEDPDFMRRLNQMSTMMGAGTASELGN